jgi:hypothetical protein
MSTRLRAGLLAAVVAITLVGLPAVPAAGGVADPLATTVAGGCVGGPGRVSLTVHPPAAPGGSYRVQVTARRLEEGSRWVVQLSKEDEDGGTEEVRRIAVEGGWTVTTRFPTHAADDGDQTRFRLWANERVTGFYACHLLISPARPVSGMAPCKNRQRHIVMLTRELDDGSVLVRSIVAAVRPDLRWHLKLTATGAETRQVVDFDARAGKRGDVRSRVEINGVEDPRLRSWPPARTVAPAGSGSTPRT